MQTFLNHLNNENSTVRQNSIVRLSLNFPPQNTAETLVQIAKDYETVDFFQLEFEQSNYVKRFYYDETKNFNGKPVSFLRKISHKTPIKESTISGNIELVTYTETKEEPYGHLNNGYFTVAKRVFIDPWDLYLICECPVTSIADAKKMKDTYFESWPVMCPNVKFHVVFETAANSVKLSVLDKFFETLPSNALPRIGKALGAKSLGLTVKSLVNPVHALTQVNVGKLSELPKYIVSPKYDGVRALLELNDDICYAIDSTESQFPIDSGDYMICDAEFCEGVYWIFDILFADGKSLITLPFAERYSFIQSALRSDKLKMKPMYEFKDLEKAFEDKSLPTDGIIFTSPYKYRDIAYKWKPASHLSIDFIVGEMDEKTKLYPLIVGAGGQDVSTHKFTIQKIPQMTLNQFNLMKKTFNYKKYYPVHFSIKNRKQYWDGTWQADTTVQPKPAGAVLEMIWTNDKWVAIRERTDRIPDVASHSYFGNFWKIAESTYVEIQNPLTKEALLDLTKNVYFQIHTNREFETSRNINNGIKFQLYEDLKNLKCVLDLATGKGQDVRKYQSLKISHLICVEPDEGAVVHLKSRLANLNYTEPTVLNVGIPMGVDVATCQELIGKHIPDEKCDAIVCSLAAHYWLTNRQCYLNFAELLASWTRSGSIVIMSFFDDEIVRGRPIWNESQYSVVYTQEASTQYEFGYVSVKLPFCEEIRQEALVDGNCLEETMRLHGFLGVKKNYTDFVKQWPSEASTADKEWIQTYCVWKFIKN